MAMTTLTPPAVLASPAAEQLHSPDPGTMLALDLATKTGWALRSANRQIISGTVSFRPSRYDGGGIRYLRFRSWLESLAADAGGIRVVHHEEVRRHLSTDAAHVHGGLLATLTSWCEEHSIGLPRRPRRYDQAPHHRQGQRQQTVGHSRGPRTWVQPSGRQRSRRHCHPALGHRHPWGRAMTRQRLPNRRPAETVELEHNGSRFTVTIGFYPDGRPGEVFTHGIRSGSNLDALLADACVVVSCLIQHGVEPREIASSMGRLGDAEPASIIGAVIDLTAGMSQASKATEEART
jgi:hypothetical protein